LDENRVVPVLVGQAIAAVVMGAAGLLVSGVIALSAVLGAGVGALANSLFAYWVFKQYRAQEPQGLVMRFYVAEVAKIAFTLALFAAAFVLVTPLSLPALLGAYLVVQMVPALWAPFTRAVR
jgi:ATP synthase protein I